MAHNELMFTEISIAVGSNTITFVGAFALPDVQPLIDKWFDALSLGATAAEEAAMAATLREDNDKLKTAIANAPT